MLGRLIPLLLLIIALLPRPIQPTTAQTSAPECAYDLSGQTIRFYHFGPLSGVFAELTQPVLIGFEDAIAYFNANGGICGATIEAEYRDTGGSQESALAAWEEFTAREDTHIMFMYLADDAELLRQQAADLQIPIVVSSGSTTSLYGDEGNAPGWVFSVTPLYASQTGAFCDYISQNWESFGIEGDPVIGHVSILGALGESSNTPEARAYCESVGVGYAGAQYFFPGIPDLAPQIEAVIADGANIIYTTSVATIPAQIAATLEALGLRDDILLAGPNVILDTATVTAGGESANGMIGQLPYLWWDEVEHPGIQQVTAYWLENRFPRYDDPAEAFAARGVAYLVSWMAVDAYRLIYIDTLNRVGEGNVTGAAMYETITSGQAYPALDGVITVQYDDTRRDAAFTRLAAIQFVETENGLTPQILPLTEFVPVPDLKPGGADVPE